MNRLNILFSLYSLTALVVIIERLLPATRGLLQPYNFIRLHEINQTVIFLSITIVLSVLFLKEISNNFQSLRDKGNTLLLCIFVVGVYLYGAGEGWHEVASFTLNQYCNLHNLTGNLCNGLFINDFYAGNIIFFIGGLMSNITLMIFALRRAMKPFSKKEITILVLNSIVYAFTWFAYAAFDTVAVGLFFLLILMIVSDIFYWKVKSKITAYPFILYSALAFSLATIGTILVKFH
jgi:hypothetical protein